MRIAALDIGGTAIKSGIWDGSRARELCEWDTNASLGGKYLMERVCDILHSCREFDAVGISTAGQVNVLDGSIHYANENIPGYTGMPVRAMLEAEFGRPVAVENDVNAAALGEMTAGAAKGVSDFLCLTYGTGVGGAIVINGELWRGSSYAGGSFGGILVHPGDARPGDALSGCYERYASTSALVRMAREIDPALESGRAVFEALEREAGAEKGIRAASDRMGKTVQGRERTRPETIGEVVDGWIDEIVFGLITLVSVFNPSHILLGGGVMAQLYIIEEIRRRVSLRTAPNLRSVSICRAGLGNQAGLIGAAYLAQRRLAEKGEAVPE